MEKYEIFKDKRRRKIPWKFKHLTFLLFSILGFARLKSFRTLYVLLDMMTDLRDLHKEGYGYWGVTIYPIKYKKLSYKVDRKKVALIKDYRELEEIGLIITKRKEYGIFVAVRLLPEHESIIKHKHTFRDYKGLFQKLDKYERTEDYERAVEILKGVQEYVLFHKKFDDEGSVI